MAGISAIRQFLQISAVIERLQKQLLRARARQGMAEPSLTRLTAWLPWLKTPASMVLLHHRLTLNDFARDAVRTSRSSPQASGKSQELTTTKYAH